MKIIVKVLDFIFAPINILGYFACASNDWERGIWKEELKKDISFGLWK